MSDKERSQSYFYYPGEEEQAQINFRCDTSLFSNFISLKRSYRPCHTDSDISRSVMTLHSVNISRIQLSGCALVRKWVKLSSFIHGKNLSGYKYMNYIQNLNILQRGKLYNFTYYLSYH